MELTHAAVFASLAVALSTLWIRFSSAQRREAVRRNNIERDIHDLRSRLDRGDTKFEAHAETDAKIVDRLSRLETGQAKIQTTLELLVKGMNGRKA